MLFPRVLAAEITARCNTNCAMCARQFWGSHIPRGDMRWKTFERCIATEGLKMVCLGQYGEPLLWPHFLRAVQACKEKGLYVWTTTNGALLDAQTATAIGEAGLDKIIFSIDAIDAETYAKIRPGLDFDKVVANAKAARCWMPNTEIVINVTRVPEEESDNDIIKAFWKPYQYGVALTPEADVSPVKGIENGTPIVCERPYEHLTIRADGEMVLCCRDAHMLWRFGNVNVHNPIDLFNSARFDIVRRAMQSGEGYPAMCRGCRVFKPSARKPNRALR